MSEPKRSWRCLVCGYVHEGNAPPDECPVCGASADDFEAMEAASDSTEEAHATVAEAWHCLVCGYIHNGNTPPWACPICGAAIDDFEPAETPESAVLSSPATSLRIVIAGAGIAGISAAEAARETSPSAEIILLNSETELPYYRLNLTRFLAGEIQEEDLQVHPAGWFEERRIDLRRSVEMIGLDAAARQVVLSDGNRLDYDRLIATTGARPFLPPIPGSELPHVYTLRTAEDARQILRVTESHKTIVGIGGGILGLETAGALTRRGSKVTVMEAFDHLMPRQLNAAGSQEMLRHLGSLGIEVELQAQADFISTDGVRLKNGRVIPADLVIIMVGVRSNLSLLRDAGLPVRQGVLVDNFMRTSDPDILAAGDVCEHDGIMYGSWAAAKYQGSIAGMNAAGKPTEFGGIPRSHSLKVLGKDMFSIGIVHPEDGSYRAIADRSDGNYRMFIIRDDRLVGALLVGDVSLMQACRKAVESAMNTGDVKGIEEITALIRAG